jgi:hypothetical protein
VTPEQAKQLGLGRIAELERYVRPYRHGRDLTQVARGLMVIDLDGLLIEEVAYPSGSGAAHMWWFGAVFRPPHTKC